MTIVCYRAGAMAADTATWVGETVYGHERKVHKTDEGLLVGSAGVTAICQRFATWVRRQKSGCWTGFDPECADDEAFDGLIVLPHGEIVHVDSYGRVSTCSAEFAAIGCASDLAMGLLLAGATAEEAVRACIENHAFAGGKVDVVSLTPVAPSEPFFVTRVPRDILRERPH